MLYEHGLGLEGDLYMVLCEGWRLAMTFEKTGLALLDAMRSMFGAKFSWRTEIYEFVKDPLAKDLLFGSTCERGHMEAGKPRRELPALWQTEEEAFAPQRYGVFL